MLTESQTDGQGENSIPPKTTFCGGGGGGIIKERRKEESIPRCFGSQAKTKLPSLQVPGPIRP